MMGRHTRWPKPRRRAVPMRRPEMPTPPPLLWKPGQDRRERANITPFTRWVREHRGVEAADYDALWRWSVTDLDGFWSAIWEYYGVSAETPYEQVDRKSTRLNSSHVAI